jgi:hypothetical protein
MSNLFLIEKTRADLVGRLCVEQIRSRSWRTLEYILDQNQICTKTSENKMQDYQSMTSRIL